MINKELYTGDKMVRVYENDKLQDRRYFLIRGLANRNITQEEYDAEVPELERQIAENIQKRLIEEEEKLRIEMAKQKKEIRTDGNLKRAVARKLIQFLKEDFNDDDIRGIMRQGYKIIRGKV